MCGVKGERGRVIEKCGDGWTPNKYLKSVWKEWKKNRDVAEI